MTVVVNVTDWSHQALNPRDPRLPVEVMRAGQVVVGDGSGGVQTVRFFVRESVTQPARSSQIYAIASFHAQNNQAANFMISVTSGGFELGARLNRRTWAFNSNGIVDALRTIDEGVATLKNALLGSPTASTSAFLDVAMTNTNAITLTAAISLFRFLPTVFQSGGPIFPQGEY